MVHLIKFVSRSEDETFRLGCTLGGHLLKGDVVALRGDLGSGKSVLARGMMRGLGVGGAIPSPSFIMVANYKGRLTVNHIDLYRIESLEEIASLGLEEIILSDGVSIIEWMEKIEDLLPERTIRVSISTFDDPNLRLITLESPDADLRSRLTSVAIDILRESVNVRSGD